MKMFPILNAEVDQECPKEIPWAVIRPFQKTAFRNHGQTLEELAQRGGLSCCEAYWVMSGRQIEWNRKNEYAILVRVAISYIQQAVKNWEDSCH